MTEKRKKEILHSILDLMEEFETLDLDIAFPEEKLKIKVKVEEMTDDELKECGF